MTQELNDYLNQLQKMGYRFHTETVFSRNDFYYLYLKKEGSKGHRLLMNGEEEPEDLGKYLKSKYNYEI